MKREIKALIAALDDPRPEVRRAAAESLGKIGSGAEVVDALWAMLTRRIEPERQSAADALMVINDRASLYAILRALSHSAAAVRRAAISAIRRHAREGLQPPTRRRGRGALSVRRSSDGIIVGRAVPTIVDALTANLTHANRYVREASLGAMEEIRRSLELARRERLHDVASFDMDDDDGWGGPEEGAIEIPPSPEEQAATDAVNEAHASVPEPRYSDFTLFATEKHSRKRIAVPKTEALRAGEEYLLEVAVRANPQGIDHAGREPRRHIHEPRQKDDVTIWITAEGDGVAIDNPTQTLVLPPKGDSKQNATFLITPAAPGEARVRLRFYYLFNILEEVVLTAKVAGKFDDVVQPEPAQSFVQTRLEREYVDFDAIQPRAMHIDVGREGAHYTFVFTFFNAERQKVEFTAPLLIPAAEIEDRLLGIRRLLFSIAASETFNKQLDGDEDEFIATLRRLAQAGSDLWTTLFRRDADSALFRIGQWLERHPLERDSIVQISLAPDATDFIFPWSLVYDRPLPKEEYLVPDPEGFWGLRYCVEQRLPNGPRSSDDPVPVDDVLKLDFVLWEHFRNREMQLAMMRRFEEEGRGKVDVSLPPLNNAETVLESLRDCDAHILYFYTHGYTRQRKADVGAEIDVEYFKRYYDALDGNSPLRATYKPLYESIQRGQFELSRSWIEPTYGKLYLDQLYGSVDQFLSVPLVILNMCESAQITPSLTDSFIHFFLDRGAGAVVGTECPMTIEFAHPFAESFLSHVLSGVQCGRALLDVRRHYIGRRNPLGLAYTLFGSATFSFRPPILVPAPVDN